MPERPRRCRHRGPLAAPAGRAELGDTLLVGIMMAAVIAAYAWLIETFSFGG